MVTPNLKKACSKHLRTDLKQSNVNCFPLYIASFFYMDKVLHIYSSLKWLLRKWTTKVIINTFMCFFFLYSLILGKSFNEQIILCLFMINQTEEIFFAWTRGLYVCQFCLLITPPPLTKAATKEFIMQCSSMHYIWSSNTKYVSLLIRKKQLWGVGFFIASCYSLLFAWSELYNCVFPCGSFKHLTLLHQTPAWHWHVVEGKWWHINAARSHYW